jgi:hypothetical protein
LEINRAAKLKKTQTFSQRLISLLTPHSVVKTPLRILLMAV